MSTKFIEGSGGGKESIDTTHAKVFLFTFFKRARELIKNVDIEIHNEYPVHCPPEYINEDSKGYQTDIAIIFPQYEKYNFGIEIDGKTGHNFKVSNLLLNTTRDKLRDEWIFINHQLPIFRLALDWIKDWDKTNYYMGLLDELEFQHKKFTCGKLPKNPLIHLARKKRLFDRD